MKKSSWLATTLAAAVAVILLVGTAAAVVGQPRTAGPQYDRNPSVVQDGALTYMFFARSQLACDRLAGCPADNLDYDLYYKVSPDGGKTFGPPQLAATNPDGPMGFYGRTSAATVTGDGTVYVFWASGGNQDELYYIRETGPTTNTFTAPAVVPGTSPLTFNVEAVSNGADIFLYTEESDVLPPTPYGIYARRFDGATVTEGPTLVALDRNIPKAIRDVNGGFRMTMVNATQYPTVDVEVSSSADGMAWTPPVPVVQEEGIAHWDPTLIQRPNGNYELYFAPDRDFGLASQRIAEVKSNDFVRWSAPHEISPGFSGGVHYWDYWPEGFLRGNQVVLFYTSERGFNQAPDGTGHIWTTPGFGGLDGQPS
jgi:hypothetical protein